MNLCDGKLKTKNYYYFFFKNLNSFFSEIETETIGLLIDWQMGPDKVPGARSEIGRNGVSGIGKLLVVFISCAS